LHLRNPEEPVLTLIHVKGSGSNSDGREISVANYEVVTGQAVKNLRKLDHRILESGLEEGIGNGGQNETRLKQLDTLLHGAKQACNGLQAEFWVIAADA